MLLPFGKTLSFNTKLGFITRKHDGMGYSGFAKHIRKHLFPKNLES